MNAKKNEKSNLEKKRFGFFQLGLIAAMALTLVAFEWTAFEPEEEVGLLLTEVFEIPDEEIQITKPKPRVISPMQKVDYSKPPVIDPNPPKPPAPKPIVTPVVFDPDSTLWEEDTVAVDSFPWDHDVTRYAEKMPYFKEFIGLDNEEATEKTDAEIMRFLKRHVSYPKFSKTLGEEGVVYVGYTVNQRGKIVDVKVDKSSGYERLDKEALRVVKKFPDKYMPGQQGMRPVNVRLICPVRFTLM